MPASPTSTSPVSDSSAIQQVDVLVIGAGVSGIGVAHQLVTTLPDADFVILEARERSGGTWDLFRYPGIRSDSDLFTFGFGFKPWKDKQSIADAPRILDYLEEAIADDDLDRRIRYHHKVIAASWSSEEARWTVDVERTDTGERLQIAARWIFSGAGYYRYDEGFTPDFGGRERFQGQIVHPQHWPEDLDYAGKRVVVIGSGATAVTLIPAMADEAAHITMLQRTPSYVVPLPRQDPFGIVARKLLGDRLGFEATRQKNIAQQRVIYEACQRFPKLSRKVIRKVNQAVLPDSFDVDKHFNPPYDPWDQRLCAVPDSDLFKALGTGKASVVTDRIATFTEHGVLLESGTELPADIIVTATGLNLQVLGGMSLTVDGEPVKLSDAVLYRGFMLSGVPNLANVIGYTNSSWTLKVGLVTEHFARLLAYMDNRGYTAVRPIVDPTMDTRPALDFGAGYVQRAVGSLPRQGTEEPWTMSMNYYKDRKAYAADVADPNLVFTRPTPAAVAAPATAEVPAPA